MQSMIAGTRRNQTCNLYFDIDHSRCTIANLRATTGRYTDPVIHMTPGEIADITEQITYQIAQEVIALAAMEKEGLLVAH